MPRATYRRPPGVCLISHEELCFFLLMSTLASFQEIARHTQYGQPGVNTGAGAALRRATYPAGELGWGKSWGEDQGRLLGGYEI